MPQTHDGLSLKHTSLSNVRVKRRIRRFTEWAPHGLVPHPILERYFGEIIMTKSVFGLAALLAMGALANAPVAPSQPASLAYDLPPLQPPHLAYDLPPLQPPHLAYDLPPLQPPHLA